jgi:hypothetical protein
VFPVPGRGRLSRRFSHSRGQLARQRIFFGRRTRATVLVDQIEAAFEQLKPQLALCFRPGIARLRKTREQPLNDRIDLRRLAATAAASVDLIGSPLSPLPWSLPVPSEQ